MKNKLPLLVVPFALIGLSQVIEAATELAKVNSVSISLEDFDKKYKENLKFFQLRAPSKKGVLDDLIKLELGVQEAKKLGLDKNPEVQDRMKMVLYHALLDNQLSKDFEAIHVSDDEAKDYYARNPEIRTSHIFASLRKTAKPQEDTDARKKIADAQKMLKAGKSFAEVAQLKSEGAAAPMGGDVDFQTRDKLDPAYYGSAVKLKKGQVSEMVRTEFGYHIIKLTDTRPWEDVDKAQVKRLVFDEKRTSIFEKYMTKLKAQAKVTVHPELLKD